MNTRLKEIRKANSLNQADFGEKIGVTAGAVSRWEAGERGIPDTAILSICREFGVSEEWLRTGVGDMYAPRSREQEMAAYVKSLMADDPESFRSRLVTALLRFDPNGPEWEVLERIYESIAAEAEAPGE